MMKYKIVFIDEEKRQQEDFLDYMDKYEDKVDIYCLYPKNNLEEMIAEIDECHPDAVISDFRLNEIKTDIHYNVPYDGSRLMEVYLCERPKFPCFVLTSYDEEAINESSDVNIVYLKNVLGASEDGKITFADRIFMQIDHYKISIEKAQNRLTELIQRRKANTATAQEEQELIDVDMFIEKSLGTASYVPSELKQPSNMERLNKLIDKADEIISKLEK